VAKAKATVRSRTVIEHSDPAISTTTTTAAAAAAAVTTSPVS